jgi:cytosine/adenosine deaminase-related metal-dependent hydrolase
MPFDVRALHSQPACWGRRSRAPLRARTRLGVIEALRNGITTIQDMNSLVPQDEEALDVFLACNAVQAATACGVAALGLSDEIGMIAPGRKATSRCST